MAVGAPAGDMVTWWGRTVLEAHLQARVREDSGRRRWRRRVQYRLTMPSQVYARYPFVRGEVIAFVADDDVWLVGASGGVARRVTADRAPAASPKISPDGLLVAYTSSRDGLPEVFVVATDGGELQRLSYWGDAYTRTIGWSDDGRVLAITAAGEPFRSRTWAYALPTDGSPPERLPYGPITSIARGTGGTVVLGVNQSRQRGAAWKRYRGGTAGALWIDVGGTGRFERFLADLGGQIEDPVFVGERLVFVSDHEGTGNLYSVLADGSGLERHSDHADFYVRAAASDGRTVAYQSAGDVYRVDDLGPASAPARVDIELGAPRSGRFRLPLRAHEVLGPFAVDVAGRASAVEARGEVHWLTHLRGPAALLAGGHGVRARLPRVSGPEESQVVVLVTDAEGEDALEVVRPLAPPADGQRRIGAGRLGRVLELAVAPDAAHAAVASHDGRVILVDLESGALREVAHSAYGDSTGLRFSPDSRLLAWSEPGPDPLRHIRLAEVRGVEPVDVTPLRFREEDPVFSLDGKYLAFLSVRTFDPVYDAHIFDMSFVAGARPYLVPLASTTPAPFDPELAGRPRAGGGGIGSGGEARGEAARAGEGEGEGEGEEIATGADSPARFDSHGLAERVVAFPVAAGRYSILRPAVGGFLWLAHQLEGMVGEGRSAPGADPARPKLVRYDIATARELVLVDALDGYEVSGDGTTVVVRDAGALRALPADRKIVVVPGAEPDPGRVDIELDRVRVELDPPLEWAQMYDEATRLMRDHFWVADMAGVDWDAVVVRYRPLLDKVATRDDLSELIWEVQGELGSSHAYEMPPERPVQEERRLGHLGADLERDTQGVWRVARIVPGESSVLGASSPLRAPGAAVREGDAIVAVDGRAVEAAFGPAALLVGAARKPVRLGIRSAQSGETRDVVVTPLADEMPLRYHAWVAGRRAWVHEASGGRVGYVHIPDMMGAGWAELHRDLRVEVAREGLVVDVRDNRGGHVSQLVLERIGAQVYAWVSARHLGPHTYPQHAPRGPRVLVANEFAGSDGDIVTAGFRQRGLGPVVGMRTWGGVIGIDSRYKLVDGSTVTQPRYAFWFYGTDWSVENHGVEPDIEVPMSPQDWADGRDPQLERALGIVLDALAHTPAATPPDTTTRPTRAAPPLPPRP